MSNGNFVDWHIRHFDVIDSTNEALKELARQGAADRTVLTAARQTAGRGRRGNQWESPAGNLYLSLLLRRPFKTRDAGQISFLTAVALADALADIPIHAILSQKWPNDVLIEGRKLAGILLESESAGGTLNWLVIGMGVNIENAPEGAICLKDIMPHSPAAEDLGRLIITHFQKWLDRFETEGFSPVRARWLEQARGLNSTITVRLAGQTLEGVFKGLDDDGSLLLEKDGKRHKIASGEVFFT